MKGKIRKLKRTLPLLQQTNELAVKAPALVKEKG